MTRSLQPGPARLVLAAIFAATVTSATTAVADDCPPGSVFHSQDGFSWCEPTVCQDDGQCKPNEVCRPVGLCMQVGTVSGGASLGDAGKRLVVTQQCAPDKTCPQTTICNEFGRCLTKTAAEKMGLLTADVPKGPEKKKSSCGCHVVGGTTAYDGDALMAVLGCALFTARRVRAASRGRARRRR